MSFREFVRTLLFLPDAGTEMANDIDTLHMFVIGTTLLGSVAVALLSIYWLFRYRRCGEPSATPEIHSPRWFEVSWTGGLLALFIGLWVVGFGQYVRAVSPPSGAEEIYVVAKQWMWKFSHPGGRTSTGVLVVPAGRDVRLIMESRDVIHSFYVPAFRLKQDVLPGRFTSLWFRANEPGTYPIYCAEFCGVSHSRMWATVVALPEDEYEDWLEGDVPRRVEDASARAALEGRHASRVGSKETASMGERGRMAADEYGCFSCHTTDGQPHIGPTWQGLFGKKVRLEDGFTTIADEQYLTRSMMDPQSEIVDGYQPVMPTYQGTLPQGQAAAIVEFIKTLEKRDQEPAVELPETAVPGVGAAGASGEPHE